MTLRIKYKHFTYDQPPVVLLSDLDLLRTLGMAGIPVIVAASEKDDPALFSRYCRGRCLIPSRYQPEAQFAAMVDIGDQLFAALGRRVPLMYGSDEWLEFVYRHHESLQEKFLLVLNDPVMSLDLLTKERFQIFAREWNLPVPREVTWETLPDLEGPVIVKPLSRATFSDSLVHDELFRGEAKALIFQSGRAVASHGLIERFREQLMFQEYISGGDRQQWSFHGLSDENGAILASFVGRKLRTWPPVTGGSAFIEMVHDEELASFGGQIAKRIRLKGPFKMDFKTDTRTGKHFLLEVNARFNLWHYLGAANGINLMQFAYDYLVSGKRPAPQSYRTNIRWISLPHDFRSYRRLAARGELSFFEWIWSILSSKTVFRHFVWYDPVPLVVKCATRLAYIARKLSKRTKKKLGKCPSTPS